MDVQLLILLNKQDYSFGLMLLRQRRRRRSERQKIKDEEKGKRIQLSYHMKQEYKRRILRNPCAFEETLSMLRHTKVSISIVSSDPVT